MKLSVPRLAARGARGGSSHTGNSIYTPSRSLSSLQTFSARPTPKHNSTCSRRDITNAATQSTPTNEPAQPSTTNTPNKNSLPSSISEHVRLLMRRVPYPVAIITATDPTGPQGASSFRGMTVSSFNTVTLTPHPVISFNVRRPSETLNALLASRRFLVHLLAPGPATATLARDFSKGNSTLASILSGHGEFEFGPLDASPGAPGSESENPLPILRRRGGSNESKNNGGIDFPFVLECTLHPQKIDVQDHSIVLGTVVRAVESVGAAQDTVDEHSTERLCLSYANTKFWKMGNET
ncbi:hypothetical protein N7490_007880 [Penicillium lividum]|nr:hypothetical protein N7490_007880 [Penicillium lividum]